MKYKQLRWVSPAINNFLEHVTLIIVSLTFNNIFPYAVYHMQVNVLQHNILLTLQLASENSQ